MLTGWFHFLQSIYRLPENLKFESGVLEEELLKYGDPVAAPRGKRHRGGGTSPFVLNMQSSLLLARNVAYRSAVDLLVSNSESYIRGGNASMVGM